MYNGYKTDNKRLNMCNFQMNSWISLFGIEFLIFCGAVGMADLNAFI